MIKTILITLILLAGLGSNAQFNQTWYTVRANDLVSMSITQEFYITGQLINYGGPLQYISPGDTFDIARQAVHDSVLLLWVGNRVQKLIFHKADSSLSVIADTSSKKELIRFYTMERIHLFVSYKKLDQQPASTLIILFNACTAQYNRIKSLDPTSTMQYVALGSLLPTAIETPEYIKRKICPLLRKDHQDEDDIKVKFINNNDVLTALGKLEKARAFDK